MAKKKTKTVQREHGPRKIQKKAPMEIIKERMERSKNKNHFFKNPKTKED